MALRHQAVRTDPVKLINGKSSSRICKGEYTTENGKRLSGIRISHSEGPTNLSMPGRKNKAGCSRQQSKLQMTESRSEVNRKGRSKEGSLDRESESVKRKSFHGDVLLQWGLKKGPRNGRSEMKATAAEESFDGSKKSVKIMRRSSVLEKHYTSLPLQHLRPSRGQVPRSNPAVRETTHANGLRNFDKCSLSDNANHVSNGLTAENSQLQDSPLSPEKPHTIGTASGGSMAMNSQRELDVEANQEPPVCEKVSLESFEWPKFVLSLSRKEKEADFLAIKGSKLPQRSKRRPKHIEKVLVYVSPGMWLSELTRERYEVREKKAVKKRPRGLKAMCSVDSDSE